MSVDDRIAESVMRRIEAEDECLACRLRPLLEGCTEVEAIEFGRHMSEGEVELLAEAVNHAMRAHGCEA